MHPARLRSAGSPPSRSAALPTPWAQPYDAVLDRNGEAWTGSMLSDRVSRLDPKTGQFVEYLLPRRTKYFRIRHPFHDECQLGAIKSLLPLRQRVEHHSGLHRSQRVDVLN